MKTYFVITDIHSFYDQMIKALKKEGFDITDHNHIIIGCGDYMDRGPKSREVCEFLYDLMKQNRTMLIRGNHEDLFEDLVRRRWPNSADFANKTTQTLCDLQPTPVSEKYGFYYSSSGIYDNYNPHWKELLDNMKDFYETPHYIFVHGWIPTKDEKYNKDWRNSSEKTWKDARWANGMSLWFDGVREPGKTIVCGHWNTTYGKVREKYGKRWCNLSYSKRSRLEFNDSLSGNELREEFSPFERDGIIALDACTVYSGFCNCLKLTEDEL